MIYRAIAASAALAIAALMLASPGDAAMRSGQGQKCGGYIGIRCTDHLWCQMGPGQCQVADGMGVCVTAPQICNHIAAPVCGCDGKTYSNDCVRRRAMVSKAHDGAC